MKSTEVRNLNVKQIYKYCRPLKENVLNVQVMNGKMPFKSYVQKSTKGQKKLDETNKYCKNFISGGLLDQKSSVKIVKSQKTPF